MYKKIIIVLALLCVPLMVDAGEITISWTAPTTNEGGSLITTTNPVDRYRVYMYSQKLKFGYIRTVKVSSLNDLGNGRYSYTWTNLAPADDYKFMIKAVKKNDGIIDGQYKELVSIWSNKVSTIVDPCIDCPSAPEVEE